MISSSLRSGDGEDAEAGEEAEEREDDASRLRLSEPVPRSRAGRENRATMRVPAQADEPVAVVTPDDEPDSEVVDALWIAPPPSQPGSAPPFSRMPTRHPSARPTKPASDVSPDSATPLDDDE